MPENTIYVGRPSEWGNPMTGEGAVAFYKAWIGMHHLKAQIKRELKGKNLACFCPLDQPCHADVLLQIANE